uniref:Translation initiation factor, putative n=1 Tax=Arundo donax TaxID=35708 RepID=A0A0A9AM85_ARUDO
MSMELGALPRYVLQTYPVPPKRSATAPTTKPPTTSTTSTSEYGPIFAIDNKRDSVSTRINPIRAGLFLKYVSQMLRVEGRRKRTLGAYFFCFFNLYFSCENTVLFPNVELFAINASTISSPLAPSLFIASMSSQDKF